MTTNDVTRIQELSAMIHTIEKQNEVNTLMERVLVEIRRSTQQYVVSVLVTSPNYEGQGSTSVNVIKRITQWSFDMAMISARRIAFTAANEVEKQYGLRSISIQVIHVLSSEIRQESLMGANAFSDNIQAYLSPVAANLPITGETTTL